MAEPPSSPPSASATAEDALTWYKSQYEHLESELADFRESSRELEQELEKDIERAEKQERVFQEKAEALGFEVEEWKVCLLHFLEHQDVCADGYVTCRENTRSPNQKRALPMRRWRRKSRRYARQTDHFS